MKTVLYITTVTILCLTQYGCSNAPIFTKAQYINGFETFVSNTEVSYMAYDETEWQKSYLRFKELKSEYKNFSGNMTEGERQEIDHLIGQYYSCVTKYKANEAREGVKHLYHQAEGFIKNL